MVPQSHVAVGVPTWCSFFRHVEHKSWESWRLPHRFQKKVCAICLWGGTAWHCESKDKCHADLRKLTDARNTDYLLRKDAVSKAAQERSHVSYCQWCCRGRVAHAFRSSYLILHPAHYILTTGAWLGRVCSWPQLLPSFSHCFLAAMVQRAFLCYAFPSGYFCLGVNLPWNDPLKSASQNKPHFF